MAPSRRCRWRRPPRSTAPMTASARCARSTSVGATCWWSHSVARVGRFLLRALPCSLGRRFRSRSRASAASNFPRCWSKRPRSRSRPALVSANMAKDTCASRWWRTSSASVKPRATSAAFLKPASKSCTTSSPWLSGARRSVSTQADDVRSEEHTSELQSRLHLVCRLLLEKKKETVDKDEYPNRPDREVYDDLAASKL